MIEIRPSSEFTSGKPGLYADVPDEVYHTFPCVSNSLLSALHKSPAECKRRMEGQQVMTDAMRFGSAAHAAVLQPMVYAEKFRVFLGEKRSAIKKAEYQEMADAVGERNIVREAEADKITAMQAALRKHRAARTILDLPGIQEVAMLWRHEATGLLVKSKVDHWAVDAGVLVDYKTTRDADPDKFEKSLYKYGYHRQGALYLMGAGALGINLRDFVVIAQEADTPEAICAMRITGGALLAGKAQIESLLREFASRKETQDWPEIPEEPKWYELPDHDRMIVDVDLPDWAYRIIYDNELEEAV